MSCRHLVFRLVRLKRIQGRVFTLLPHVYSSLCLLATFVTSFLLSIIDRLWARPQKRRFKLTWGDSLVKPSCCSLLAHKQKTALR